MCSGVLIAREVLKYFVVFCEKFPLPNVRFAVNHLGQSLREMSKRRDGQDTTTNGTKQSIFCDEVSVAQNRKSSVKLEMISF